MKFYSFSLANITFLNGFYVTDAAQLTGTTFMAMATLIAAGTVKVQTSLDGLNWSDVSGASFSASNSFSQPFSDATVGSFVRLASTVQIQAAKILS
jgi:hypothetical protein